MKKETFTEIYRRYAASLKKSVVAQTNDRELAAEICQQTFLNLYQKKEPIDEETVWLWLLRVSKNLLIDYWRKASTRNEILQEMSEGAFADATYSIDMQKQSVERQFICEFMEDLRKENKLWYDVIDHVYVLGESYEEAAKQLGTTPSVLRSRMYRAKCYIQEKYGDDYLDA